MSKSMKAALDMALDNLLKDWKWRTARGFPPSKRRRGKLSPNEQCIVHGSEYSDLRSKAVQLEKQIICGLSDDGKRTLQEYQELRDRMAYISEEDMFVNGFRIGVGLILDAVGSYKSQFVRYHED